MLHIAWMMCAHIISRQDKRRSNLEHLLQTTVMQSVADGKLGVTEAEALVQRWQDTGMDPDMIDALDEIPGVHYPHACRAHAAAPPH